MRLGLVLIIGIFTYSSICYPPIIEKVSVEKNLLTITPNQQFKDDYLTSDLFVRYNDKSINLHEIDETILTIPFILSSISMIWHSGQQWEISQMDEDLYFSLQKINKIFKLFFPEEQWNGELIPQKLVPTYITKDVKKKAILFSGGLDAICASFAHINDDQLLITIGGNDVPLNKNTMWANVKKQARDFAKTYNKNNSFIVSNFFDFIKKNNPKIKQPFQRWWWYYTSQSLSYSGLVAPLLFWHKLPHLYLGSSFTIDYPFGWGTHPLLDNNISFCGIDVTHEQADLSRQDKLTFLEKLHKKKKIKKPKLRVCWNNDEIGDNCCKCEKCLRTINNIITELQYPKTYGFNVDLKKAALKTKKFITKKQNFQPQFLDAYVVDWQTIQNRAEEQLIQNKRTIKPDFYDYLTWFLSIDFKELWLQESLRPQEEWDFYTHLWELGLQGKTDIETLEAV